MEALLAGDFDDDDDDDDESFDENQEVGEDQDEDDEQDGAYAVQTSRLPLHAHACAGNVEGLTAALEEGVRTGQVTIGRFPDGSPRTVSFDLNQVNEDLEPPLHATMLATANALALAAA